MGTPSGFGPAQLPNSTGKENGQAGPD